MQEVLLEIIHFCKLLNNVAFLLTSCSVKGRLRYFQEEDNFCDEFVSNINCIITLRV
jgi:hypothetical protein